MPALITPTDPGYDQARQAWNRSADQRPALIAEAESEADVAEAFRVARAAGLRVVPQGTGHGVAALPDLSDALLLRTARMDAVSVDPPTRLARVGAGAVWRDVIAAAAPHGLAAPHGFAAGVGVTGYLLGGGLGWLARSHGFGSSRVRAFDVVTDDGERQRVDAEQRPERFRAMRGGGPDGVVVTAIELELIALRELYAGTLLWPFTQAMDVFEAYRAWIATVPDTVTSSLRLLHLPDGRALVQITLAYQGADGDALVAPLRAVAPRLADTAAIVPACTLGTIAGDPEAPMPAASQSLLVREIPPAEAFVALAGPTVGMLELRHLGGALREQPGAIGGVDAAGLVFASASPGTAALDAVRPALVPWAHARETLPTFDERVGAALTAA
ncbi:FAD binding domain-containing protein [Solirubrobacter pauli]|uniref:FAD binding domain-containing protein n=1 Tax=Solirubrobacter pauli TaxID=166793 RepID=A0A660LIP7_9ACTN|nr:FAD-dependent oxidoreductase [Solirubrobacter pauli]RKQ93014.1 FAD binding domain-containing protein [Solirubrobacter pauli]